MTEQEQLGQIIESGKRNPFWSRTWVILGLIVLSAALLRLVNLRQSPPGLNQDEAANAWNAYCLLKTGKDQAGVSWPIFYTRGLGGHRSTLYIYLIIPFQAIGGLNVVTARLPGAVGGVVTVLLIYFVGKRLFDRKVGLVAAALLALNPWHLQQSRWGHEASIGALLGILPLALLLWANLPMGCAETDSARPTRALAAGILTGICCYGYHSVRLFIPIFLLGIIIAAFSAWRRQLKSRRGIWAITAFALGFALTFGPLAAQHIFHPEGIGRHSEFQTSFFDSDPLPVAIKNIIWRYLQHFGPDFLFVNGDQYPIQSPPGIGQLHWYMLPLLVLGLIALVLRLRSSCAARILLLFVIIYPVGDCFYKGHGMHALRSALGLSSLILLAALGAVAAVRKLGQQNRLIALTVVVAFVLAGIILNARYLYRFYGEFNRQSEVYHGFYSDLVEACNYIRPQIDNDDFDAVFCSTDGMGMAYIVTLVSLGYDPDRWFRDTRDFKTIDEFDFCWRYGKIHFMFDEVFLSELKELQQNSRSDHVVIIARPGELGLSVPIHKKFGPGDKTTLLMYFVVL